MTRTSSRSLRRLSCLVAFACVALSVSARSADWPTYRGDAARSGFTDEQLATDLHRHWSYRSHRPQPAWPSSPRQTFDRAYHVVIADGRLFFGSSADHQVHALDAATGEERWTFFTDGPVRLTPAVASGRVFAVSDDGCLYALDAATGTLAWKRRGGPSDEVVLGNDRFVSAWTARGGPTIVDDDVYWAAGIWPTDGIFVMAVDAATGERKWTNDSDDTRFMPQPHGGANAASGISAQGHLAVNDGALLLPTGRAVPATLDRTTGEFRYFHLQKYGQFGGTSIVALGEFFANEGRIYNATTGLLVDKGRGTIARLGAERNELGDGFVRVRGNKIIAYRGADKETKDRKGNTVRSRTIESQWTATGAVGDLSVIVAGNAIVTGGDGRVGIFDAVARKPVWSAAVDGKVYGLAVADGRLYASTDAGTIHCFAPGARESIERVATNLAGGTKERAASNDVFASTAAAIVTATGVRAGYCIDIECGDGRLAAELAARTDLHILASDADPQSVESARLKLDALGLYGTRVTVHHRDPSRTAYPKYSADLVVSAGSVTTDFRPDAKEAERLTRPFGGVRCFGAAGALKVERRGRLEGAGEWTHQYSDPANTCCSTDARVKAPLRMLWFRDADLPMPQRHGRAPAPLFKDGYLVVLGMHALRCSNAYNGRTLWEYSLPNILAPYDSDHLMGTAGTGSNVCIGGESVYVHRKKECVRLDLATGRELGVFPPPEILTGQDDEPGTWGTVAVTGDTLWGTLANTDHVVKWRYLKGDMTQLFSESSALFAMDRKTGALRWTYRAERSIRHNTLAIGADRVYLIDREIATIDRLDYRRPAPKKSDDKAGGEKPEPPKDPEHVMGELVALDAATGEEIWRRKEDIWGTMLALGPQGDVLLMGYQATRFRLPSERGGRMAVFHTKDGYRLWDKPVSYASRPLINGPTIYAQGGAWDAKTGVPRAFNFERSYGCGILAGSTHLMLFRSATMGYFDLRENRKIANYGGVRPGCWINAIPAGGIVLVPDGSAGCVCSYLNRASIALQSAD